MVREGPPSFQQNAAGLRRTKEGRRGSPDYHPGPVLRVSLHPGHLARNKPFSSPGTPLSTCWFVSDELPFFIFLCAFLGKPFLCGLIRQRTALECTKIKQGATNPQRPFFCRFQDFPALRAMSLVALYLKCFEKSPCFRELRFFAFFLYAIIFTPFHVGAGGPPGWLSRSSLYTRPRSTKADIAWLWISVVSRIPLCT